MFNQRLYFKSNFSIPWPVIWFWLKLRYSIWEGITKFSRWSSVSPQFIKLIDFKFACTIFRTVKQILTYYFILIRTTIFVACILTEMYWITMASILFLWVDGIVGNFLIFCINAILWQGSFMLDIIYWIFTRIIGSFMMTRCIFISSTVLLIY